MTTISEPRKIPGTRARRRAARLLRRGIGAGLVLAAISLTATTLESRAHPRGHATLDLQPDSAWASAAEPLPGARSIRQTLTPFAMGDRQ